MMIVSDKRAIAMALAGALAVSGCGKKPAESQPGPGEPAVPAAAAEAEAPAAPPEPGPTIATNEALSGAAEFQRQSLASPFAQAELALKESYNRALIAFQIGDYARAVTELDDLAKTPGLTPEQQQAVKELRVQTLKLAPELTASNTATARAARPQTPAEFPVVVPGAAETPKNLPENPFSTADPAVKETFARAKAAYDIGNYETASVELRELATNAQLNWQQKYAIQSMLDKTPQVAPAQTPKR